MEAKIGWNVSGYIGKNRLRKLGFNIPAGKITARQAVTLNKAAEELPSESDVDKADEKHGGFNFSVDADR